MTNDMGRTVTKSIAIIGEGETEWVYFDSLRIACRYPFKVAPDFPQHSDIKHILKLVESYLNKQYDYIVCLFDMDRLFQFPSEMQLYQRAKKEYSKKKYALWNDASSKKYTEFFKDSRYFYRIYLDINNLVKIKFNLDKFQYGITNKVIPFSFAYFLFSQS